MTGIASISEMQHMHEGSSLALRELQPDNLVRISLRVSDDAHHNVICKTLAKMFKNEIFFKISQMNAIVVQLLSGL